MQLVSLSVTLLALSLGFVSAAVEYFPPPTLSINDSHNELIPLENVKTVSYARIDPIVTPGRPHKHVQNIVGGTAINSNLNYSQARESSCKTIPITDDKSSYWGPSFYYIWENGTFSAIEPVVNITYLLRPSNEGSNVTEFPPNFQMMGGSSGRRNRTGAVSNDYQYYVCEPFAGGDAVASWIFPDIDCRKITTVVNYPWCWNGKELSTGQPSTHVRYPNGTDWVDCPDSDFPVRLPRILYKATYDMTPFPFRSNSLINSLGDKLGYSLHGGFVNGWQEGYLVQVFDTRANCRASLAGGASSNSSACSAGLRDFEPSVGQACKQELASSVVLDESVGLREPIEKLNGCNPYSGASEDGILLPPCGEDGPQGTFVNPASWWGDAQVPLSAEELDDSGDDDEGGSNTGAIVGGVIGGAVGLSLLGFAFFWFLRRRNRQRFQPHPPPSSEAESALKTTPPPYSDRLSTGLPPSSTSPTSRAGLTPDTSTTSPSPSDQTRLSHSERWSSPITIETVGNACAAGGANLEGLWSGVRGQERTYVNQEGKRVRDVETKAGQL